MIKNLWNNVEVVCGCHKSLNIQPPMSLIAGNKSMFYACPRYYPDARDAKDVACINHLTTDDFQKILAMLSEELENRMMEPNPSLVGLKFKLKLITVEVVEHTTDKITISVINKRALAT